MPVIVLALTGCAAAPKQQEAEDAKQPAVITEVAPKPQPVKHPPVKIGVVDLLVLSQRWKKWHRLAEQLEDESFNFQAQIGTMENEITRLEQQLRQLPPGAQQAPLIQDDIKENLSKQKELFRRGQKRLKEMANKFMCELISDMERVIRQYGKMNGYSFIVKKSDKVMIEGDFSAIQEYVKTKTVLYYNSGIDLTEEIIKILNEKYK
jgi:Skp family chaperone for outer membrane proteins